MEPAFSQTAEEVSGQKAFMRTAWNTPGAGYHEIAMGLLPAVEHLLDLLPISPGMRLLDLATGTGIAAQRAAARGARVTGIDFAPDLLAEGRRLAALEGLDIAFDEGDVEVLPYPDASFDAVISTFGVIFAPRHDVVTAEIARVVRPGGLVGLATWKPEGPNLRLMTLLVPFMQTPPPTDRPGPLSWGRREYVMSLFGDCMTDHRWAEGNVPLRCESIADAIDLLFHRGLGPTIALFNSFDAQTRLAAHDAAIALLRDCLTRDGEVNLARDYLLMAGIRRPS